MFCPEIGVHVGCLGVYAAADPMENGDAHPHPAWGCAHGRTDDKCHSELPDDHLHQQCCDEKSNLQDHFVRQAKERVGSILNGTDDILHDFGTGIPVLHSGIIDGGEGRGFKDCDKNKTDHISQVIV